MADILSQASQDLRGTYAKVTVLERILSLGDDLETHRLIVAIMAELATWFPELKRQPLYKTPDRSREALKAKVS